MKAKKVYWLAPLLLATLIFQPAHKAYAHFPASDGDINAVLHIEPDDYPTPGAPQTLYLILNDITGRFQLANCACNLTVSQGDKLFFHAPLTLPPAGQPTIYSNAGLAFTFPASGLYQIEATGKPLTAKAFQPFSLSWQIQINQAPDPANGPSFRTFVTFFGLILALLAFIGLIVFVAG